MKTVTGSLVDRWCALRAHVAQVLPTRPVDRSIRRRPRAVEQPASPRSRPRAAEWWLALFLIVAGPLLLVSVLLAVLCGGGLWDCAPAWHDEMWYFNEMSVFEFTGWTGGYTVSQEWPSRTEWVRFGTHGPFVPVLYGTFARWTGMHLATIPILNACLLVLGSACFVACSRLNVRQAWVAVLVAVTYWPLILYIPTSMQEGLHLSIAFTLAGLSVLLLRNSENRWLLALGLVAVAIASQTRVTWSFVAVPMLWVALRPRDRWQTGVFAVCSLSFVAALYVEAIMLVSPYPNFMKTVLEGATDSPLATCWLVFRHTIKNIVRYISPNHDPLLQVGFRLQVLMIAGAAIYHLRQNYLRRSLRDDADSVEQTEVGLAAFGFALLNLICIVGFVVVLYDVFGWADYRVVAPHLLLALLVLVGCGSLDWLKGYAVVALMLFVLVVVQFPKFHRERVAFDASQVASFAEQVDKVVTFEPGASAWDNTLLMDMHYMDAHELLTLPRGIGISTVIFWEQQAWPPRSKYVLLTADRAERLGIPHSMRKVAETRIGDIYARR